MLFIAQVIYNFFVLNLTSFLSITFIGFDYIYLQTSTFLYETSRVVLTEFSSRLDFWNNFNLIFS